MKILVEVDVFDDPDYCEDGMYVCSFLVAGQCRVFDDWPYCKPGDYYRKCDQCKKAYQKALNKQP